MLKRGRIRERENEEKVTSERIFLKESITNPPSIYKVYRDMKIPPSSVRRGFFVVFKMNKKMKVQNLELRKKKNRKRSRGKLYERCLTPAIILYQQIYDQEVNYIFICHIH